jgi:hypothetical protein
MRLVLVGAGLGLGLLAFRRTGLTREGGADGATEGPVAWPGEIARRAAHGERHGPWKSAVAIAPVPRPGIKRGDAITVLPLKPGLQAVDLKITSVEAQEATDLAQAAWLVEAETASEELLVAKPEPGRSDERPFEAVVIYPAQPHAHLLPSRAVATDLPKDRGCSSRTLWAAVDLGDDGKADAEIFRFCCERPSVTWRSSGPTPCNSSCESIFVRSGAGPWRAVHQSGEN